MAEELKCVLMSTPKYENKSRQILREDKMFRSPDSIDIVAHGNLTPRPHDQHSSMRDFGDSHVKHQSSWRDSHQQHRYPSSPALSSHSLHHLPHFDPHTNVFGTPPPHSPQRERAAQLGVLPGWLEASFEGNQSFPKASRQRRSRPDPTPADITMNRPAIGPRLEALQGEGMDDVSFSGSQPRKKYFPRLKDVPTTTTTGHKSLSESWSFSGFLGNVHPISSLPSTVRNPNKAICTITASTSQILTANDMACLLFGYDESELMGRPLKDLLRLKSKEQEVMTESHLEPSGQIISLAGKVVEVVDSHGLVLPVSLWVKRLDTSNTNTTTTPTTSCAPRKPGVEGSKEESRLLCVMEPVERTVGHVQFDAEGEIQWCDDHMAQLCGYAGPHQVSGMHMSQLIPAFHFPDPSRGLTKEVKKQRATGRTRDGVSFPLSIVVRHDDDDHDDHWMIPSTLDPNISEDSRPLYRATVWVFANISGLISLTPDGTIHSLNANFARLMFGYDRSELIGQSISKLIPDFFDLLELESEFLRLSPMGEGERVEEEKKCEDVTREQVPSDSSTKTVDLACCPAGDSQLHVHTTPTTLTPCLSPLPHLLPTTSTPCSLGKERSKSSAASTHNNQDSQTGDTTIDIDSRTEATDFTPLLVHNASSPTIIADNCHSRQEPEKSDNNRSHVSDSTHLIGCSLPADNHDCSDKFRNEERNASKEQIQHDNRSVKMAGCVCGRQVVMGHDGGDHMKWTGDQGCQIRENNNLNNDARQSTKHKDLIDEVCESNKDKNLIDQNVNESKQHRNTIGQRERNNTGKLAGQTISEGQTIDETNQNNSSHSQFDHQLENYQSHPFEKDRRQIVTNNIEDSQFSGQAVDNCLIAKNDPLNGQNFDDSLIGKSDGMMGQGCASDQVLDCDDVNINMLLCDKENCDNVNLPSSHPPPVLSPIKPFKPPLFSTSFASNSSEEDGVGDTTADLLAAKVTVFDQSDLLWSEDEGQGESSGQGVIADVSGNVEESLKRRGRMDGRASRLSYSNQHALRSKVISGGLDTSGSLSDDSDHIDHHLSSLLPLPTPYSAGHLDAHSSDSATYLQDECSYWSREGGSESQPCTDSSVSRSSASSKELSDSSVRDGTGDTTSHTATKTTASPVSHTYTSLPSQRRGSEPHHPHRHIPEGSFSGQGRHKDGAALGVAFQIRRVKLTDGTDMVLLWLSRDPEDMCDVSRSHGNLTLASSFNSTLDQSQHSFGELLQEQANSESKLEDIQETEPLETHHQPFSKPYSPISHHDDNDADLETSTASPEPTSKTLSPTTNLGQNEEDEDMHEVSLASAGEFSQHYTATSSIGKGAFGFVKLGRRQRDGEEVVVKFIRRAKVLSESWVKDAALGVVPMEVFLLSRLSHPNIVKVIDVFQNSDFIQLVMERHGCGMDLFEFIDRNPRMDEPLTSYIFRQMVSGVSYLHKENVVHRDIKDENIIIDQHFNIKLIDFGAAAYMLPGRLFATFCGTIEYCSPEVLKGNKYRGPELEMWSLGITLYTLIFGENPFFDVEDTLQGVLNPPNTVSRALTFLITWLLHPDPLCRATISDVERNAWVNQHVDPSLYHWTAVLPNTEFYGNTACDNREDTPDCSADSSHDSFLKPSNHHDLPLYHQVHQHHPEYPSDHHHLPLYHSTHQHHHSNHDLLLYPSSHQHPEDEPQTEHHSDHHHHKHPQSHHFGQNKSYPHPSDRRPCYQEDSHHGHHDNHHSSRVLHQSTDHHHQQLCEKEGGGNSPRSNSHLFKRSQSQEECYVERQEQHQFSPSDVHSQREELHRSFPAHHRGHQNHDKHDSVISSASYSGEGDRTPSDLERSADSSQSNPDIDASQPSSEHHNHHHKYHSNHSDNVMGVTADFKRLLHFHDHVDTEY